MNATISIIRQQSKWLAMLVSLLAGMLCATALQGQEVKCDAPEFVVSTKSLELVADSVLVAPPESVAELGAADDQFVVTRNKCRTLRPVQVSATDEIWRISARDSHRCPCDLSVLRCSQLRNGAWVDSKLDELIKLHSSDKSKVTMLYAHGNRTDLAWANSRGLQLYKTALQNKCLERPPVRLVIFAWKSEVESIRLFPDYVVKSERSVLIGQTFGKLLCQFEDRNMLISGFSLGGQVVLSGLSNPGLQTQDRVGKFKVALFAPAFDPSFVGPDLQQFPCNPVVQQTDVFLNRADRAIKIAQRIARKRSKCCGTTLDEMARTSDTALNPIRVHDITDEVSKRHSIIKYAKSSELQCELAAMLHSLLTAGTTIQVEPEQQ